MKVKLITHTPNPELVVATAAKVCYSHSNIFELFENGLTTDEIKRMIDMITSNGHSSVLEHANFTFIVEGVSRAELAQHTRHRIASYSVKSQRYVDESDFGYVTPPEIENDKLLKETYDIIMEAVKDNYDFFVETLSRKYINNGMKKTDAKKKAQEDARFILPNACETQFVVTMNARSLMNFFSLRCCNRAQWEIRELADEMLKQCKKVAPNLFAKAGASCMFDKCPEGDMCCGQPRKIEEYM